MNFGRYEAGKMKIAVYCRSDNQGLAYIEKCLNDRQVDYEINPCQSIGFDVALSVGGDGTFLNAMRKMGEHLIPILGINSGRLGFLATIALEDVNRALDCVLNHSYSLQERMLLHVSGPGMQSATSRALNEFTVQKSGTSMLYVQISVRDQEVAQYWADGIIVSTPTGSTAYSMSVGGAILTPDCQSFIISPIAPHNLNIRPVVLPASNEVEIRVTTRHGEGAMATIDNREVAIQDNSTFQISRDELCLQEIVLEGYSFYNTLRSKLMWGMDLRK